MFDKSHGFFELLIAVSTAGDGNMSENWGKTSEVSKNRDKFLGKSGIKFEDCVKASLLSKSDTRVVGNKDRGMWIEADGLITCEPNLTLWMVVGDCFPVVFYDPKLKILGLAHLGYGGINSGLINRIAQNFRRFGSSPQNVYLFIGPGIRKESYVRSRDRIEQINNPLWRDFLIDRNGMSGVDLVGFMKRQLTDCGIDLSNVDDCGIDTGKDKNYFSHYRSQRTGEEEGRFAIACRYWADSSR